MSRPWRPKTRALVVSSAAVAAAWAVGCVSLGGLSATERADDGDAAGADADSATSDGAVLDGQPAEGSAADQAADSPAACPRGVCPTTLTATVGPQRLALSSAAVYWASSAGIGRVALDGSTSTALALAGAIAANLERGIAVSPTGVPYVTTPNRGPAACAMDLSSCGTGFIGSAGAASSVAVDATYVYAGIFDDQSGGNSGAIWRTGLDGNSPTPYSMVVEQVLDLQVVGATTYYRTSTAIRSVTSTTAPVAVADLGGDAPLAFVVQGSNLIVATTNGHLRGCTLNLGLCSTSILQTTGAVAVTADGAHVFWVEGGVAGSVHRCDLPSCTSNTLLAGHQASPSDIAVDGTSVYWANHGDSTGAGGAIMKLPK